MSADVVLLGIGHTNAHALRMWLNAPLPGARLTCVSSHQMSTYSGMLPGVLAGQYSREHMEIDLEALCAAAGAHLIVGEVSGLDRAGRALQFADRAPLPFDVLSIGIGSVPSFADASVIDDSRLVPVKPMQTFLDRFDQRLQQAAQRRRGAPIRISVVGGGASGAELALCLPPYVQARLGDGRAPEQTVVSSDDRLLPGSLPGTARRVEKALKRRGVRLLLGRRAAQVHSGHLAFDDGSIMETDVIVWLTNATAPPLLAALGLPTDSHGFLLTTDALQTTAGDPVFAVGDSGTIAGSPTPKAGVFAVRQGPVLWENIGRTLAAEPLQRYTPQPGFLKLLNTGDGRAIGEWRGLSFEGAWAWRLKNAIDRRFVRPFQGSPAVDAGGSAS
ncbi:MAG: FAD-dependent oxidoreductase [Vicinamibacterales bacterium]